jgi:hypothetical protein
MTAAADAVRRHRRVEAPSANRVLTGAVVASGSRSPRDLRMFPWRGYGLLPIRDAAGAATLD